MKRKLIGLLMFTSHLAFGEVNFIDRSGKAELLRDQQNAVIYLQGEVAQMIHKFIDKPTSTSQISCGENQCAIGQINRQGKFSAFSGVFASTQYFERLFQAIAHPQSISDSLSIEKYLSDSYAYPTQCQSEDGRRRKTLTISLEGLTAERLYNYILNSEKPGIRTTAMEKSDLENYFFCEKMPEHESEDLINGVIPKNIPPSYHEYRCDFEVESNGHFLRRSDCNIYGGAISAGGGD